MENLKREKKVYFIDFIKFNDFKGKLYILYFIATGLLGVLFSPISTIVKIIFCLASAFLFLLNIYRTKYLFGLKNHPTILSEDENYFEYYNEYRGVIRFKLSDIRSVKTYSRKGDIYLIEIFMLGTRDVQNINVEGFNTKTVNEMINDLKIVKPNIIVESNHSKEK